MNTQPVTERTELEHLRIEVSQLREHKYELRAAIITFLDEADAGGIPSYASLRTALKLYKDL